MLWVESTFEPYGVTVVNEDNLIWIDLEMTGLDPFRDQIIEIATLVTDSDLKVLAEGPVLAIRQPEHVLAAMDDWNQTHHAASGLLERVRNSREDERSAEVKTLAFLEAWCKAGASPLCGNSICQDRRFLARWMPRLESFFHYRNLDVSTVKILAQRWAPQVADAFKKEGAHLALSDIKESIAELAHYRAELLRI
ncbi:oligoribonuclease [Lamprobacter modestohalophilus]|uniref:Oligoribonuclease n=1 Tax=Lamprobacter modestohalophilus TaxID=1064514 RepID=A0A9X0W6P2_9GAMM|nr:oligoribonuclease [Lamprobacter modestohalophilus]MBK1617872.1 oligoribonuclease [Lamprobacter modestohalophilus]MEA1049766.1 oligoribonuclease [Lamprobacter modestohalophilus]